MRMGQIINFNRNIKQQEYMHDPYKILQLMPYIKSMERQKFVIQIPLEYNENQLEKIIKEILILKNLNIYPILILSTNSILKNLSKKFNLNQSQISEDEILQIIKFDFLDPIRIKINKTINENDGLSISINANECNLTLEKNDHNITEYFTSRNNLSKINSNQFSARNIEKSNPKLLLELEKTNIIPIISPICDNKNNQYIIEDNILASLLSQSIQASKLIILTEIINETMKNAIYSISKFQRLVKISDFSEEDLFLADGLIRAVKNGAQNGYIIDINSSILEEICSKSPNGLMLYNESEEI